MLIPAASGNFLNSSVVHILFNMLNDESDQTG